MSNPQHIYDAAMNPLINWPQAHIHKMNTYTKLIHIPKTKTPEP